MKTFLFLSLVLSGVVWAQEPEGGAPAAKKETAEETGPDVSKMTFSPDSVKKIVMFHQPKVIACYEEMLASREKPIEGVLMTWFVIDAEGVVSKAKIQKKGTTLKDKSLNDCVLEVISSMTFPKPPDGDEVPIEFPFKLTAVH